MVHAAGRGPVLAVLGPTATGKSELAVLLAERLHGRVINADSIQVYRGLEAGSCKPSPELRRRVRHELIDVADPREAFSAGRFAREAWSSIAACREAGEVPIVAGGAGLYLKALLHGIAPMPPRDEDLRRRLLGRARLESPEALHVELGRIDPDSAARLGPRDVQRVVRALEVVLLTGRPLSAHIGDHAFAPGRLPALKVGLRMERAVLHRRIDDRVERIFASGVVEEVRGLLEAGVPPAANALKGLGYREVLAHLRRDVGLEETRALVKRNTRRYARRQMSWFLREPDVLWKDADGSAARLEAIAGEVAAIYAESRMGA